LWAEATVLIVLTAFSAAYDRVKTLDTYWDALPWTAKTQEETKILPAVLAATLSSNFESFMAPVSYLFASLVH
jgi:hypothetical protein